MLDDDDNTYLYGLVRIGEEQPGGWAYHHGDALGSVRQLTDENGDVTLVRSYQPYGEVLASSGDGETSYSFTGEWADASGLIFLRARFYSPYLNQWIQPDTIVPDPYIPADLNRYAYARNNPINFRDPTDFLSCKSSDNALCVSAVRSLREDAVSIKASVTAGDLLPVQGFAHFIDKAAERFDYEIDGMMWGLTNVLLGADPNAQNKENLWQFWTLALVPNGEHFIGFNWLPYKNDPSKDSPVPNYVHSERGDWRPEYWDGTANQAYHFWGFVAITYYDSALTARGGNIFHDPYFLEPDWLCGDDLENLVGTRFGWWPAKAGGTSREDYMLSLEGIRIGQTLGSGNLFPPFGTIFARGIGSLIESRLKEY